MTALATPPPIFVVGAPRSGTTLLATMLAAHSRIACGPETQFFNKLSYRRLARAADDPQWPARAVELVASLTLAGQPVLELFGHSRQSVGDFLAERAPSVGVILESLTALYAANLGKVRWAEKTPNHLRHLPTIRAIYPDAPIIRILRDPRDSASSMRKLPWASSSPVANGYTWSAWYQASQPFFETDAYALTVRYEDLVADPTAILTHICRFIGEAFETEMLEAQRYGRSVASPNEPWKAQNSQRLDTTRTQVWQRELTPQQQRAITYICLSAIKTYGYPFPQDPTTTLAAFPLNQGTAELHESALLAAAAQGISVREPQDPEREHELLLLPGAGGSPRHQLKTFARVGSLLLSRRLQGRSTLYLAPSARAASKVRWPQRASVGLSRVLGKNYDH